MVERHSGAMSAAAASTARHLTHSCDCADSSWIIRSGRDIARRSVCEKPLYPLDPSALVAQLSLSHATSPEVAMPMPGKHKITITILICDDNEEERLRTQQALEGARISNSLRFVTGGAELLDYLYQRGTFAGETGAAPRPGLILLGLDASTRDGEDALREIRQAPTLVDIPIVGLTTSSPDDVVARSEWLGVSSFITKPVTFLGLMEAMTLVGRYWLEIVELSPRLV